MDQGSSFISKEVREFAESCAQTNGQAESSNKIFIKLIKKKIE